jgi:hypothetical protein
MLSRYSPKNHLSFVRHTGNTENILFKNANTATTKTAAYEYVDKN